MDEQSDEIRVERFNWTDPSQLIIDQSQATGKPLALQKQPKKKPAKDER